MESLNFSIPLRTRSILVRAWHTVTTSEIPSFENISSPESNLIYLAWQQIYQLILSILFSSIIETIIGHVTVQLTSYGQPSSEVYLPFVS